MDFTSGIQPIDASGPANALVAGMQARRQRQQQMADNLLKQQQLELQQRQAAAQETRANAAEQREQRLEQQQTQEHRARAAGDILPHLDPTSPNFSPDMAAQKASLYGMSLRQLESQVPAPGPAPQAPQAPSFVGPIDTPEHARAAAQQQAGSQLSPQDGPVVPRVQQAGDQAAQEAMQQQMERDQYAQQLAQQPALLQKHADEQKRYELAKQYPQYQLDMGGGQPPITVDTMRMHRQAEASRQARGDMWGQLLADDEGAKKIALPMALSGAPDVEIRKALDEYRIKGGALAEKQREFDQHDATIRRGQDMRGHKGGAGGGIGGKAFRQEEGALAHELDNYNKNHALTGAKSISEQQRELSSALDEAGKNPNGATQLRIMDKMIRSATGLGVRNQTLQTYMRHLGGLAAQGEGKLEEWASGELGKRQWQAVVESMRSQLSELEAEGGKENEEFKSMIANSPAMQRHPDLVKRREAEMFGGMHGFNQPSNPILDAQKKNVRNQKIQAMQPADKAAVDWADKHPDDPRAQKILQLHGL